MEVYAGALSYADNQIGRLIDELEASGQRENTLVIFIMGDNGASPKARYKARPMKSRPIRAYLRACRTLCP